MTIRTIDRGGTDWADGQVLYAADLNNTIDQVGRMEFIAHDQITNTGSRLFLSGTNIGLYRALAVQYHIAPSGACSKVAMRINNDANTLYTHMSLNNVTIQKNSGVTEFALAQRTGTGIGAGAGFATLNTTQYSPNAEGSGIKVTINNQFDNYGNANQQLMINGGVYTTGSTVSSIQFFCFSGTGQQVFAGNATLWGLRAGS